MCFLYFKMVVAVFFLAIVASTSSRVSFELETCGVSEYRCSDGRCISGSSYCDGRPDCDDGSDESHCELGFSFNENPLSRSKRQASTNNCKKNNFRCKDGTCISSYDKCDGVKNCPDGSDETFALCRNNKCQSNWFRCMYGACVDGTAPCNKVSECADNSDELLPRCRNEKQDIKGSFKCDDGQIIPMYSHCDGARDCADGSDETLRTCAGKTCPSYVFQCAYGACVDQGSDCDFKQDCADNSDESDELCNRNIIQTTSTTPPSTSGLCVLPPYPRHGKYAVTNLPFARPGQAYQTVVVRVNCDSGYRVMGNDTIFCINGQWQAEINDDTCAQFCKVPKTPSAKIRCKLTGDASGSRVCQEYEPPDTELDFKCEQNYIQDSSKDGVVIVCLGGTWSDSIPCIAECGTLVTKAAELIFGGEVAQRGEVSWHTAIYSKLYKPYMQMCGGTLVNNRFVISAAHCFWDKVTNKKFPASNYAVAMGKIHRPYTVASEDSDAQKSDVTDIFIPPEYQGANANFQADLAVVRLAEIIIYTNFIRPICLDFRVNFESLQLSEGNKGKVAGWGLTGANEKASQILKVVDLPFIPYSKCVVDAPVSFRSSLTFDKICAGYNNGTAALCHGDSGGGLAFRALDKDIERYYLRGVVSTAPSAEGELSCNENWYTAFTQISKHENFIKKHIYRN